jgi:hypothetical protein
MLAVLKPLIAKSPNDAVKRQPALQMVHTVGQVVE